MNNFIKQKKHLQRISQVKLNAAKSHKLDIEMHYPKRTIEPDIWYTHQKGGAMHKKRKSKKTHIGLQKKHTWNWFSIYIRLKYSDDNGYCKCITCDKVVYWTGEGIQAGHGIAKGNGNGIYFLEEVVRPQCGYCNGPLGGRPERFIPILQELYGQDGIDEFAAMKLKPKKYTIKDLAEMEKEYKELALSIAAEKGIII